MGLGAGEFWDELDTFELKLHVMSVNLYMNRLHDNVIV